MYVWFVFLFEGWGAVVGTQCVMGLSGVNQVNVPVWSNKSRSDIFEHLSFIDTCASRGVSNASFSLFSQKVAKTCEGKMQRSLSLPKGMDRSGVQASLLRAQRMNNDGNHPMSKARLFSVVWFLRPCKGRPTYSGSANRSRKVFSRRIPLPKRWASE